jgi:single-strand DNA-binding protein
MDVPGEWVNEVRLVGRVSAAATERVLPSGDVVASLRLVVPRVVATRSSKGSGGGGRARADTLDVSCWTARTRQRVRRLQPGDVVEVVGSLHRRFYRAGAVALSRHEVEATSISRVSGARTSRAEGA